MLAHTSLCQLSVLVRVYLNGRIARFYDKCIYILLQAANSLPKWLFKFILPPAMYESIVTITLCWEAGESKFFINPHLRICLLIFFRKRGRGRERERNINVKEKHRYIHVREKHQLVASHTCPNGDWNCNLGMCPNWELNPPPFGVRDSTLTNWATIQDRTV